MSDAEPASGCRSDFDEALADIEHDRCWRAHHEAGHATAVWVLGAHLIKADLLERPPARGRVVYRLGNDEAASIEDVIIAFAGPIAARRFARWSPDGGDGDRTSIEAQLSALAHTPDARAVLREHCRQRAGRIIDQHWDVVAAIAGAFLTREILTGEEIDEIAAEVSEAADEPRRRAAWQELENRVAAANGGFSAARVSSPFLSRH